MCVVTAPPLPPRPLAGRRGRAARGGARGRARSGARQAGDKPRWMHLTPIRQAAHASYTHIHTRGIKPPTNQTTTAPARHTSNIRYRYGLLTVHVRTTSGRRSHARAPSTHIPLCSAKRNYTPRQSSLPSQRPPGQCCMRAPCTTQISRTSRAHGPSFLGASQTP